MTITRRELLARGASTGLGALAFAGIPRWLLADVPRTAPAGGEAVHFFVVADTHYLADKTNPAKLEERSAAVNGRLIETLNRQPGTEIPAAAGGGAVAAPRGVIHGGDMIDTGDKTGALQADMQRTEWASYTADFGLTGKDGKLKYPVYEVHGNHDGPRGKGIAVDGIIARNRTRPAVTHVSENGLHYSWDWGPAHFVNLGIVVGATPDVARVRRYDPLDSFGFLVKDLKEKVGASGRPVVITHHVDVARYTGPCERAGPAKGNPEWDPCDCRAYHAALAGYNVVGIFYGHTHARSVFKWDGASAKAQAGVSVFNVDNSAHFNSEAQAFYYVTLAADQMTVREYATKDAWETGGWTPQVWTSAVAQAAAK